MWCSLGSRSAVGTARRGARALPAGRPPCERYSGRIGGGPRTTTHARALVFARNRVRHAHMTSWPAPAGARESLLALRYTEY
jgi:hypothetical protein